MFFNSRRAKIMVPFVICFFLMMGKGIAQKPKKLSIRVITTFPSPGPSPQGLAWDGVNLFIADDSTNTIYKLSPLTGKTLLSFSTSSIEPRGLSWDDAHLIMMDNQNSKIHKLEDSGKSAGNIIASINVPAMAGLSSLRKENWGLGWDGRCLYTSFEAGWSSQIIKLYADDDSISRFSWTRGFPRGLAFDGSNMWSCSNAGGRRLGWVDQYDLASGLRINSFDTPGYYPTGIAYDGNYFWIADNETKVLYKIEIYR